MNKLLKPILCCSLFFGLFGCSTNQKNNEVEFDETEPIQYTEDEQMEDQNYEELKDKEAKINVDGIIGTYDAVIYTVFGYPFVRGTEEWDEVFEETETFGITILDSENIIFDALEGKYTGKYTLEGNVITIELKSYVDEEVDLIEGIILEDCILIDLDGAKLYLVSDKKVEEAVDIANDVIDDVQPELDIQ